MKRTKVNYKKKEERLGDMRIVRERERYHETEIKKRIIQKTRKYKDTKEGDRIVRESEEQDRGSGGKEKDVFVT